MMREIYKPILAQVEFWINYEKNKPKTAYKEDKKRHDEYRAKNDLDCKLCGGELRADTIFSLWTPLRFSIFQINGKNYNDIKNIAGYEIGKELNFLEALKDNEKISKLLPECHETTKLLSDLFYLGQTKANVMVLPKIGMNSKRGQKPYYDYMPHFLHECFKNGDFADNFNSDDDFRVFVKREKLECFFKGDEILQENIIDLAGTGDIKNGIPKNINVLLENYRLILEKRS